MKKLLVMAAPIIVFYITVYIMTALGADQKTILLVLAALFTPFIIRFVHKIDAVWEERRKAAKIEEER